jgi:hypothetical protein
MSRESISKQKGYKNKIRKARQYASDMKVVEDKAVVSIHTAVAAYFHRHRLTFVHSKRRPTPRQPVSAKVCQRIVPKPLRSHRSCKGYTTSRTRLRKVKTKVQRKSEQKEPEGTRSDMNPKRDSPLTTEVTRIIGVGDLTAHHSNVVVNINTSGVSGLFCALSIHT